MKVRFVFLLLLSLLVLPGCRTSDEADNMSARPWNSPRGWEHGIPGLTNEGR